MLTILIPIFGVTTYMLFRFFLLKGSAVALPQVEEQAFRIYLVIFVILIYSIYGYIVEISQQYAKALIIAQGTIAVNFILLFLTGFLEELAKGKPISVSQGDVTVVLPDSSAITYEHKCLGDERMVKETFRDMLDRLSSLHKFNKDNLDKYAQERVEKNIKSYIVVFASAEREISREESELFEQAKEEWNEKFSVKLEYAIIKK